MRKKEKGLSVRAALNVLDGNAEQSLDKQSGIPTYVEKVLRDSSWLYKLENSAYFSIKEKN